MDHNHRQHTLEALRNATESVLSTSTHEIGETSSQEDLTERLRNAALRLLSVRDRSSHELATRLRDKGFPTDLVEDLIERFTELGLLDDARFTHEWVTSRTRHSARGKGALRHELRYKGIPAPLIEAELAALSPELEEGSARTLLARKLRTVDPQSLADHNTYCTHQRRLYGMLARRGFSSEVAQRLVSELLQEHRDNSID